MDPGSPRTQQADEARAELDRLEAAIARSIGSSDSSEAAELHFRAGQICLILLDQQASPLDEETCREQALRHLWATWRLRPTDVDCRTVLGQLLEANNQPAEAAKLYRESARHLEDEKESTALLLRSIELLRQAQRPAEALDTLRQVSELNDPTVTRQRTEELRMLLQDLPEQGQEARRIEALSMLLNDIEGEELFGRAIELAKLHEEAGDREATYGAYRQALTVHPTAPGALDPVQRHLEREEAYDVLANLLEQTARATMADKERASLWRRLAEVVETRLLDARRAASYWWQTWILAPGEDDAPANLKRIYTKLEDWKQYQQVLQQEAQWAQTTEAKVEAYRELATFLREVLEDEMNAAQTYGLILQLIPDDEAALAARVEIFESGKHLQALAVALRRSAAHSRDTQTRDHHLRRLIHIQMQHPAMGNPVQTMHLLDPAESKNRDLVRQARAELDPSRDRDLFLQLGSVLLHMERLSGGGSHACAELAMTLAEECIKADAVANAADALRQALALRPGDTAAKAKLDMLSRRTERSDLTAADLASQAEACAEGNPTRAVRLLIRAARVIALKPVVSREALTGYLRRAVILCPQTATEELSLLEEALWSAELYQDLEPLLEELTLSESTPDKKKHALHALARLHLQHLGQPEHAARALAKILAMDPQEPEALTQIRQIYEQLGDHASLANVLEGLLSSAKGRARVPLLQQLGHLYAHELKESSLALSRYGELLAILPNHPEALQFCRTQGEATGDFRSVVVLLRRAADTIDTPVERAEVHREIAKLAENRLGDQDLAVTHWRQVVALCPTDAAPRGELKRLLVQAGQWRQVERLLLSEASRSQEPEQKVHVYQELARLAQQHLNDDRTAARYLRHALQLAPENREVLVKLEAFYERGGRWRELTTLLDRHAKVEPDINEKIKLLIRSARVLYLHLDRHDEAMATCQRVLDLRPGDRAANAIMGEIYARREQWDELAALLVDRIASETDPKALGQHHLDLGRILLDRLEDHQAAAAHFELALELNVGGDELLPLLHQLYASLNQWDHLTELIRRRATAESVSIPERAAALCEIGRITDEHLGDHQGAKEAYERALHLAPDHTPALAALRSLAQRGEQWRDQIALSRRELQLTDNTSVQAKLLVEMGEILYGKLGRPGDAAEMLQEALKKDPAQSRAVQLLSTIYFENQDWERATLFLEQVIGSGLEPEGLHELHYQAGYALEQLGREDDAFSHYVKSFGREPMYLPTLQRLIDLCYARRQWDNTLRIAEAIVTTYAESASEPELAELYLRIALCEIYIAQHQAAAQRLKDLVISKGETPHSPLEAWMDAAEAWASTPLEPRLLRLVPGDVMERAAAAVERSLSHAPTRPDALQVFAALCLFRGDWERSLRSIEHAVKSIQDDPKLQAGLLVCAGDVVHRKLHALDRAESYYSNALSLHPGSRLARERLNELSADPRAATARPIKPRPTRQGYHPSFTDNGTLPAPASIPEGMPPIPEGDHQTEPRPAPRSRPRRSDDD